MTDIPSEVPKQYFVTFKVPADRQGKKREAENFIRLFIDAMKSYQKRNKKP